MSLGAAMRNSQKRWVAALVLVVSFLYGSGLMQYLLTVPYEHGYKHPGVKLPISALISQHKKGGILEVSPVNTFNQPNIHLPLHKCVTSEKIKILYLVKSDIKNLDNRQTIRQTWGHEHRFADVSMRTVFLLGQRIGSRLQSKVDEESRFHGDILQAQFEDDYQNITTKAMMALSWAFETCQMVEYFFFVDDDYYVSPKNLLRFLRNPQQYPRYLDSFMPTDVSPDVEDFYAGYVFRSSAPIRWYFSKWYVTLSEYPYSYWPPYITAGAFVLSRASLEKLYYASIYTNYFRMDDVFFGMAAKKAQLTLFNHRQFHFDPLPYNSVDFKYVLACHGFHDPHYLAMVWNEQRSYGNA